VTFIPHFDLRKINNRRHFINPPRQTQEHHVDKRETDDVMRFHLSNDFKRSLSVKENECGVHNDDDECGGSSIRHNDDDDECGVHLSVIMMMMIIIIK